MKLPIRLTLGALIGGSLLLGTAAPAAANYGGRVDSSVYGAQYGYTVRQFNSDRVHITGVLRDLAADQRCAYVRIKVHISHPWRVIADPVTAAIVCGNGNTVGINMAGTAPILLTGTGGIYLDQPTIDKIEITVCRRRSGVNTDCRTQNRYRHTT